LQLWRTPLKSRAEVTEAAVASRAFKQRIAKLAASSKWPSELVREARRTELKMATFKNCGERGSENRIITPILKGYSDAVNGPLYPHCRTVEYDQTVARLESPGLKAPNMMALRDPVRLPQTRTAADSKTDCL
jgi:hypothetical protein